MFVAMQSLCMCCIASAKESRVRALKTVFGHLNWTGPNKVPNSVFLFTVNFKQTLRLAPKKWLKWSLNYNTLIF